MIYDRNTIDEVTNEDLDSLIVDVTASEDKENEYKKAFNKLFDLTRRYVDNRTTTTNNEN